MPVDSWECPEHGNGRCDGDVAVFCVRGKEARVDCSSFLDAACDEPHTGKAQCVAENGVAP